MKNLAFLIQRSEAEKVGEKGDITKDLQTYNATVAELSDSVNCSPNLKQVSKYQRWFTLRTYLSPSLPMPWLKEQQEEWSFLVLEWWRLFTAVMMQRRTRFLTSAPALSLKYLMLSTSSWGLLMVRFSALLCSSLLHLIFYRAPSWWSFSSKEWDPEVQYLQQSNHQDSSQVWVLFPATHNTQPLCQPYLKSSQWTHSLLSAPVSRYLHQLLRSLPSHPLRDWEHHGYQR